MSKHKRQCVVQITIHLSLFPHTYNKNKTPFEFDVTCHLFATCPANPHSQKSPNKWDHGDMNTRLL